MKKEYEFFERDITILPGFRVDRRQLGGSVVWQLKHLRRKYWVSFEAASSVCMIGMLLMEEGM